MDALTNLLVDFFTRHPELVVYILAYIVIQTLVKAIVDALVASREQWDKTPLTDDNWYEKAVTWAARIAIVLGRIAGYLIGIRSKLPANTTNKDI